MRKRNSSRSILDMNPSTDHIPLIDIKPIVDSREQVIKAQIHVQPSKANFFSIYRHANASQLCLLFVSATCAAASGAAMPLVTLVFGSLAKEFINERDALSDDIRSHIQLLTLRLIYIGMHTLATTVGITLTPPCSDRSVFRHHD